MTHIEDNRQSEVKGTAQDHSRQRSRTSDRPNGVSSIDRIKNTQKSFDESLLPWFLGRLTTFIAIFYFKQISTYSMKVKKKSDF